jgi:uncharacterized iron-regulated membrane protein
MASAAVKSKFYKWHRVLGLIGLVPVIFWTLSGLSHPFMSNWFRPFIAKEVFKPLTQREMKPVLSVQQVMDQNHLQQAHLFMRGHIKCAELQDAQAPRRSIGRIHFVDTELTSVGVTRYIGK